jgi:hypothetical protein
MPALRPPPLSRHLVDTYTSNVGPSIPILGLSCPILGHWLVFSITWWLCFGKKTWVLPRCSATEVSRPWLAPRLLPPASCSMHLPTSPPKSLNPSIPNLRFVLSVSGTLANVFNSLVALFWKKMMNRSTSFGPQMHLERRGCLGCSCSFSVLSCFQRNGSLVSETEPGMCFVINARFALFGPFF